MWTVVIMLPKLLSDLKVMRSKDVSRWYGEVMGAWGSLNSSTSELSPTLWRNLGYWHDRAESLDQAATNLATKLADAAEVRPGCDVLDVGCGLGESTFLLRERLDNGTGVPGGRLTGLDITEQHIAVAVARRTDDRPEFVLGSAVQLPFDDQSFDRILALECAFHFPDRRRFFAEALRVLRPGGVLGMADVVVARRPAKARQWMNAAVPRWARVRMDRLGAMILKTPSENLVTLPQYLDQLRAAGLVTSSSEDISDRVFPYFRKHWRTSNDRVAQEHALRSGGLDAALAHAHASAWRRQMRIFMLSWPISEYVIVTARKPGGSTHPA
jgi:ubiquinone/menaquinone biosynthesis C-methylase UbiE